jgi:hypothetical protein
MSAKFPVPFDEAISRLQVIPDYDDGNGARPCVHTFVEGGIALLGAHWGLEEIEELGREFGFEETGGAAKGMNHGLAILRDDNGPLFLETKPEEAEA